MQLPYLKESKWPRIAKPEQEKIINDPDQELENMALDEMFDSAMTKDHKTFRMALENIVRNCFEYEEDHGNE